MSGRIGFNIHGGDGIKINIKKGKGTDADVDDYNKLRNRPEIEGNVLEGNKTFKQLGLGEITPQEIDDLFDEMFYGG